MKKKYIISEIKYFSSLFILIFLFSCSKKSSFTNPEQLNVTEVISSDVFGYANELAVIDSFLIINDSKPLFDNNQLRIYNKNSFKYISSSGRFGSGPGEFRSGLSLNTISSDEYSFSILDLSSYKMLFYSIDKLGELKHQKSITLKKGRPYMPTYINDTTIFSLGLELHNGRFGEYDSSGLLINTLGEIPPGKEDDTPIPAHHQACKGLIRITPDRTKLIISYQFADLIEIYSINGSLLRRIEGPRGLLPQYKVKVRRGYPTAMLDDAKCILGYIDITVSNSHIFALFSGQLTGSPQYEGKYLHIFSMDGELNKHYKLNSKMSQIAFDKKNSTLLGVSYYPYSAVYRFDKDFIGFNL